jgi:hypothetical protein
MLRQFLLMSTFFFPILIGALELGSYGQKWGELKYATIANDQKIEAFDKWITAADPQTKEERLWICFAKSTKASLIGGAKAAGEISDMLPELEILIKDPKSELEFMGCALAGYLYAKLPGWPIAVGSKSKGKDFLNKALVMKESPNVAFYLAHGYFVLGDSKLAIDFLNKSRSGFENDKTSYGQGKLSELNKLELDIKKNM